MMNSTDDGEYLEGLDRNDVKGRQVYNGFIANQGHLPQKQANLPGYNPSRRAKWIKTWECMELSQPCCYIDQE